MRATDLFLCLCPIFPFCLSVPYNLEFPSMKKNNLSSCSWLISFRIADFRLPTVSDSSPALWNLRHLREPLRTPGPGKRKPGGRVDAAPSVYRERRITLALTLTNCLVTPVTQLLWQGSLVFLFNFENAEFRPASGLMAWARSLLIMSMAKC